MKKTLVALAVCAAAGLMIPTEAQAADILCETITNNHMLVDDSLVSECVDAGVGNIGNGQNDDFLAVNSGYTDVTGEAGVGTITFTQNNGTGTFNIDPALWDTYDSLAIGFKFGTGNQPDEWFVYLLQPDVSEGDWTFVNVFGKGGGLSHLTVYATEGSKVPEPATLGLLTLGMLGFGLGRRREQTAAV